MGLGDGDEILPWEHHGWKVGPFPRQFLSSPHWSKNVNVVDKIVFFFFLNPAGNGSFYNQVLQT